MKAAHQVFLDYQSTTPVLPEVFEAMRPYFTEWFGSPASLHSLGLRARDALAHAREQFADLVNAESAEDILFTSGGTESANLAIKGVAYASQRRAGTKKYYGDEGNSFVAIVEFGPRVRAVAVSTGGESGRPGSNHFQDQAERYITGQLRPVYFYPDELKGHVERVYHPGE